MYARRRWLFSPLHLVAFVVWATVFASVLSSGIDSAATDGTRRSIALVAAMLAFLAGFLIETFRAQRVPTAEPVALTALAVEAASALGVLALTGDGIAPALLIIVVAQAVDLPRGWLIALMCMSNLALLAILLQVTPGHSATTVFLMYLGFQAFAGLTGHYVKNAERSRDELALVNAHLLATRALLEESARDGERLRLARELHDVAGHKLTALKLHLALLARDRAGMPPAVAVAEGLAGELLDDLRGVVGQMRRHDGLDIKHAIEQLAASLPQPRVHVEIAEGTRVADVAQAQALLRTAQEALTNAARHSAAANVWLTLSRSDARITLDVRDDGHGTASIRPGNGLTGMRERIEALGGGLDLAGDRGFRVSAWLPLA